VEAQEAERRRISADLHDNLGAYATAISANVDDLLVANETGNKTIYHNIKSNADDILNSLNETIWVLNKTEIHLTNLCDRFKSYVTKISDSYPDILVNIHETITENTLLSPEATLNLLRIMQEAFHNAIRHSKGTCITVEIKGGTQVEISITDNGIGLGYVRKAGGHGLSNMEKRAKANGWQLTLKSEKGNGTVVKLTA
jgi:signal transduction histidine kinase